MKVYRRFDALDRGLHAALIVSFLGLALTGMPLLFSESVWASRLARLLGGVYTAGIIHRMAAILLIGVFLMHLARIGRRLVIDRDMGVLWGPSSMTPQPRDIRDLFNHLKWFFGQGPRPRFDRYTYWEKFDYFAVFWGMGIIGLSGLMLWFPTAFARVVPGWMFNIAALIHGEEALLAVGFIFTVHFFNTHMRPEKFPMDPVIFTGRLTEEEFRAERADEYDRLLAEGRLERQAVGPAPEWVIPLARVVAVVVLTIGFAIVALIALTVIDSAVNGDAPHGSFMRPEGAALTRAAGPPLSPHQVGVVESGRHSPAEPKER